VKALFPQKIIDFFSVSKGTAALFLLIPLTYFVLYLFKFWPLGVTNGWYWDPNFGDLKMAIKMMSCSLEYGFSIYKMGLLDGCGGYTYGFWMALLLDLFGVRSSLSSTLGVLFFLGLILSMIAISKTGSAAWEIPRSLLFLIFISPGFWLAIVHGSIDIPVYVLLVVAFFCASKGSSMISFLIVLCTVLMKLFTLPLLLLLALKILLQNRSKYQGFLVLVSSVLATLSTAHNMSLVNYADSSYRMAQGIFHTFGIESIPIWLEVTLSKFGFSSIAFSVMERKFLGFLLLISFTYLLSLRNPFRKTLVIESWKHQGGKIHPDILSTQALVYLGLPYLGLFMQGQNYDNKLMFLSLPVFAMYQLLSESKFRAIFIGVALITFWFTCFFPRNLSRTLFVLVEITGDFFTLLISSLLLLVILTQRRAILRHPALKGKVRTSQPH